MVRIFPDLVTVYALSAVDAGPFTTAPVVENIEPWQGHGKLLTEELNDISHPW